MKKILLFLSVLLMSLKGYCQPTTTIGIQYYVDANSNCSYDNGEVLIYNVPSTLNYIHTSGTVATTSSFSGSFATCSSFTMYVWNPSVTPTNTLIINAPGVTANACGNFTNLPYNSNNTVYLPVTISGTANLGVQLSSFSYYSYYGSSNYTTVSANNSTIGLCSNIGSDSVTMNFNIANVMSCNNSSSVSPRTYSLYFDGTQYDVITINAGLFASTYTTGVNNLSNAYEFYNSNQTYLTLYPEIPATFSVLGQHTLEVKSSMIYNTPASALNFKIILNSIPCTKISGKFYNDCNNNCVFDGTDTYGVGPNAIGRIYNSSGTNVYFWPSYNGNFAVYLPTTMAYSLTQYPSGYNSPVGYTACTTGTTTIPAASTNTFLFGYQNNSSVTIDPAVYLYRVASTSNIISPLVGAVMAVNLTNNGWNICNVPSMNPGRVKVTLPKFINYVSTVSGVTPTFVAGATLDTLIYTVPNFSAATNWWNNSFSTFSVVVSATAVANTTFTINATIYPTTDVNLSNNSYSWVRTIGGPFDPNGKYNQTAGKLSNGDIPYGTQTFIYEIGFQNIGNAPAINITTMDTIDANFDMQSIRILSSSFPVSLQSDQVSRTVGFHFKQINLPGAQVNEPASHGFVRYSIKLKPGVVVNTVLKNRAHNYFDFLSPVATNQTANKLVTVTAINEYGEIVTNVKAVPNPFNSKLKIESTEQISEIKVYNLSGQLIMDLQKLSGDTEIDMETQPQGIYLIKLTSVSNATSYIKVVKQ